MSSRSRKGVVAGLLHRPRSCSSAGPHSSPMAWAGRVTVACSPGSKACHSRVSALASSATRRSRGVVGRPASVSAGTSDDATRSMMLAPVGIRLVVAVPAATGAARKARLPALPIARSSRLKMLGPRRSTSGVPTKGSGKSLPVRPLTVALSATASPSARSSANSRAACPGCLDTATTSAGQASSSRTSSPGRCSSLGNHSRLSVPTTKRVGAKRHCSVLAASCSACMAARPGGTGSHSERLNSLTPSLPSGSFKASVWPACTTCAGVIAVAVYRPKAGAVIFSCLWRRACAGVAPLRCAEFAACRSRSATW